MVLTDLAFSPNNILVSPNFFLWKTAVWRHEICCTKGLNFVLVFWSASSKGLERDEKRRNIEEIPENCKIPSSVTSFPAIVGTHFQDTESHSLFLPRHLQAQRMSLASAQLHNNTGQSCVRQVFTKTKFGENGSFLHNTSHTAETADPALSSQQLRTESYPSLQPPMQHSHLS